MTVDIAGLADRDKIELTFPCLKATQPIGDLYISTMPYKVLTKIAYFDVRRVLQEQRDVEKYLGIQRPLDRRRVGDLEKYVNYQDATFPTAIILAIDAEYVSFDESKLSMTVRNFRVTQAETAPSIPISNLARVIDGQHRIAGLLEFEGKDFVVPVTLFIGSDIADQAYVFSTVNLEQTKVNRSLAYDLFELAKARSPQKTAHHIAVALDRDENSPFYHKIKRLGVATSGKNAAETITQAQFVEAIIQYISKDPKTDRDRLLRGHKLELISGDEARKLIFRNLFIQERDIEIAKIFDNFFSAVREKWPTAWAANNTGTMLNRTNGFRGLVRFMRDMYNHVANPGVIVSKQEFAKFIQKSDLKDEDFTPETFLPGSSGEGKLYHTLREKILGEY